MKDFDLLLNSKAVIAEVNPGDIKFDLGSPQGMTKATISGQGIAMSDMAMEDLYKTLGMTKKTVNSLGGAISPTAGLVILQKA